MVAVIGKQYYPLNRLNLSKNSRIFGATFEYSGLCAEYFDVPNNPELLLYPAHWSPNNNHRHDVIDGDELYLRFPPIFQPSRQYDESNELIKELSVPKQRHTAYRGNLFLVVSKPLTQENEEDEHYDDRA